MRTDGLTDGWMDRQTERQTDMTKLTVASCSCAKGPKNKNINEGENALRTVHPSLNRIGWERGECAKCYKILFSKLLRN